MENLKVLLSTTMKLLGYWWPLFKCGEGRGHDDRFTWKIKLSAARWMPKIFPGILSQRGTCALHEYVRYWNIHHIHFFFKLRIFVNLDFQEPVVPSISRMATNLTERFFFFRVLFASHFCRTSHRTLCIITESHSHYYVYFEAQFF